MFEYDEQYFSGIVRQSDAQATTRPLRSLVRSPNRSPLVEPADEWVQHQWRRRVQEEEEIHDNM